MFRPKKAFTLIELLVVISIIALLLSILMPALKLVKRKGQGVVCKANLKQWNLCYSLYTQENDSSFPQFSGINVTYMQSLRDYYDNINEMRTCGLAVKVDTSLDNNTTQQPESFWGRTYNAWQIDTAAADWMDDDDWGIGSYGENTWIRNVTGSSPDYYWKKHSAIRNTAKVPVLGDSKWNNTRPDMDGKDDNPVEDKNYPGRVFYNYDNWYTLSSFAMRRHKDGVNMAFADFSVRPVRAEDLWSLKWHKKYDTRNDMNLDWMKE